MPYKCCALKISEHCVIKGPLFMAVADVFLTHAALFTKTKIRTDIVSLPCSVGSEQWSLLVITSSLPPLPSLPPPSFPPPSHPPPSPPPSPSFLSPSSLSLTSLSPSSLSPPPSPPPSSLSPSSSLSPPPSPHPPSQLTLNSSLQ